jgi:PAS domain S-box-containing protein
MLRIEKKYDGCMTTLRLSGRIEAFVWSALPDGSLDFFNKPFQDYTGLPSDQLYGSDWKSSVHPDEIQRLETWWQDIRQSHEAGSTAVRIRGRRGEYRWFQIMASPAHDDQGNIVRWCGINTEINEGKFLEDKACREEIDFSITEAIPIAIAVLAADGTTLHVNRLALGDTGLTLNEVKGKGYLERIYHPGDLDRVLDERRTGLSRGVPFELEMRFLRENGEFRWHLAHCNPLRNEFGHIVRWYVTATDIDDRKRGEQKLRQSEEDLRTITDTIRQPIIVLAPDGSLLYANRVAMDNSGLTQAVLTDSGFLSQVCHREDVDRVARERSLGLSKAVPFDIEIRVLFKKRAVSLATSSIQSTKGRFWSDPPLVRYGHRHR